MTSLGIAAIGAGVICAIGLIAEWVNRRRQRRDDRREARILAMQEHAAQSNGHPRTGLVEVHGLIPRD